MKPQKTSVKSRLSELLISSGLELYQFAKLHGVEYTTLNRMINGDTETFRHGTIKSLAERLGVNYEWLAFGKGERNAVKKDEESFPTWRDEALANLKSEVAFYRQLLTQMAGGKANFRMPLSISGLSNGQSTRRSAA